MLRPWKITLGERIDAALPTPLYLQIVHAVIHEIERGRLPSGAFLPSSRELAQHLSVNRKTVVLAYEDLISQGWLTSRGTRGTVVSSLRDADRPAMPAAAQRRAEAESDRPAYPFQPAPERPIAWSAEGGIKLDEGSPDGRLFPADVLSRAYRTAVKRAARSDGMSYRDPRGTPWLRAAIADMLKAERGLAVTKEHICITRGSQHGIFLAAQLLIAPGDAVLVETLTYEPAVTAFAARGARIVPVPLDEQGIDIDAVGKACRKYRVRAIFLTPHHQFPTTVALRPDRRLRLLELARQFDFALIEDDYDHEFHFESQPLLPMASYAPARVIYVGSLSKLLLPALRIGYVAAPPPLIDAIAHQVSTIDGMGNSFTEDAVAELIESGELRRHARKATQVYADRRTRFAAALGDLFGDRAAFRVPDGGLAFWLRFADADTLDRIERAAPALGLRFADSRSFATSDRVERGLRLGFASPTPEEARTALSLLARAAEA